MGRCGSATGSYAGAQHVAAHERSMGLRGGATWGCEWALARGGARALFGAAQGRSMGLCGALREAAQEHGMAPRRGAARGYA